MKIGDDKSPETRVQIPPHPLVDCLIEIHQSQIAEPTPEHDKWHLYFCNGRFGASHMGLLTLSAQLILLLFCGYVINECCLEKNVTAAEPVGSGVGLAGGSGSGIFLDHVDSYASPSL